MVHLLKALKDLSNQVNWHVFGNPCQVNPPQTFNVRVNKPVTIGMLVGPSDLLIEEDDPTTTCCYGFDDCDPDNTESLCDGHINERAEMHAEGMQETYDY